LLKYVPENRVGKREEAVEKLKFNYKAQKYNLDQPTN
jgi:hypothetical protein